VYLSPISKDFIAGGGSTYIFEFSHNLENNIDEFLGYEIFYKFYPPGSVTIADDIIAMEEKYVSTQNFIENRGFHRLQREDKTSPPLLPLSGSLKESALRIHMDFLDLALQQNKEEPVLTVKRPATETVIYQFAMKRIPAALNEEPKKFIPEEFVRTDPDVVKAGIQSLVDQRAEIAISFCVLAYGRDSNFSPIYSEAVFLIDRSRIEDALIINLQ
jgi:hypothetical protein